MSRLRTTAGSRAALRYWRLTDRANTKARFWASMFRCRTGLMPGRRWSIGSSAGRRWTRRKSGVTGVSFGSFFGTIMAAHEPRIAATAVMSTCLEPGCHTIFEEASPTFKKRFMWMANYTDEGKFDEFVKTLTWEGHAEKIRGPYLVVAGEADELSPLEYTERMIAHDERALANS